MHSFDSSLSTPLKLSNTTAFWVLKLYHSDESEFVGVSDRHRVDGSDKYHGLVADWGGLNQSLDFFNFSTSTASMTVKLINTKQSILGGRFSDLLSSYNFANRKWELFLNTETAGTYDTAARMIGFGVISGEFKYTHEFITLSLLDNTSKVHNEIPKAVIQNTDSSSDYYFANPPAENVGKPIPIFYGDAGIVDGSTTGATVVATYATAGEWDHHFTKSKVPAIITDQWNTTDNQVFAQPDSVACNSLSDEHIWMYKNDYYVRKIGSEADASAANSRVDFSGTSWDAYIPLVLYSTSGGVMTDWANTVDGDLSTFGKITASAGSDVDGFWVVPQNYASNLGDITSVKFMIYVKDFDPNASGNVAEWNLDNLPSSDGTNAALSWRTDDSASAGTPHDPSSQIISIDAYFSDTERSNWDLNQLLRLEFEASSVDHEVEIYQAGIKVELTTRDQVFHKQIPDMVDQIEISRGQTTYSNPYFHVNTGSESVFKKTRVFRTKTVTTTDVGDYVYVSGSGRKYPAWVDADSRNNGYNQNDLIENPVYMIEDIYRSELGLSSSNIDYALFDTAGNTTDGTIKEGFDDSVGDIIFCFSQYKFVDSKALITKLCQQIMGYSWISGDGKAKIKTLVGPDDATTADATIDYNDIVVKGIGYTPLNNVRNKIKINYAKDYARDTLTQTVETKDDTSIGNGTTGYNDTLELELDAEHILDKTTATALAAAYLKLFKDRKITIEFDIQNPKHSDLEIADYITFSNWDSDLDFFGTSFSSDIFIISKITKYPNRCSVEAIQVY